MFAVGEKTTRHAAYLNARGYDARSLDGGMMALKALNMQRHDDGKFPPYVYAFIGGNLSPHKFRFF